MVERQNGMYPDIGPVPVNRYLQMSIVSLYDNPFMDSHSSQHESLPTYRWRHFWIVFKVVSAFATRPFTSGSAWGTSPSGSP
jgi:hypothetical protein